MWVSSLDVMKMLTELDIGRCEMEPLMIDEEEVDPIERKQIIFKLNDS